MGDYDTLDGHVLIVDPVPAYKALYERDFLPRRDGPLTEAGFDELGLVMAIADDLTEFFLRENCSAEPFSDDPTQVLLSFESSHDRYRSCEHVLLKTLAPWVGDFNGRPSSVLVEDYGDQHFLVFVDGAVLEQDERRIWEPEPAPHQQPAPGDHLSDGTVVIASVLFADEADAGVDGSPPDRFEVTLLRLMPDEPIYEVGTWDCRLPGERVPVSEPERFDNIVLAVRSYEQDYGGDI